MTSNSSLSSSLQGRAFWLGAAAGAAVGCCATAALLAASSPNNNSSSNSNSRCSNSNNSCSNSNSSCSNRMERGMTMMPSCAWLRELSWWKRSVERISSCPFSTRKEEGEEDSNSSAGGSAAVTREVYKFAAGGQAAATGGGITATTMKTAKDIEATTEHATEHRTEAATAATGGCIAATSTITAATAAEQLPATAGGSNMIIKATGAAEQQDNIFDTAAAEERGEACPGPDSDRAGAAAACAGCPNRGICSSSSNNSSTHKEGFKSTKEEIATKLSTIKKKILILSGKGGVGKSTITAQLGWTAASRGLRVGVLDVDVCGPSIPLMMHARQGEVHQSAEGWQPVYVHDKLAVMSIGFLLPEPDAAIVWRGPKKNGLIYQFLADVLWGDLDLLLIDTPPGTSDEHLSIVSLLDVDGALVITTPQEAALQDVRKELNFCTKVGIKVLGVVENMANSVFSLIDVDGAKKMCTQMKVPYAGSVPLDASLLRACEEGVAAVEEYADQPGSQALQKLMTDLLETLGLPQNCEDDEDD